MDEREKEVAEFMQLYKPVKQKIATYCKFLAGNNEAAADLLQDTLLAAFETFGQVRKAESFVYYLSNIARNKFLKQKRWWNIFDRYQEIRLRDIEIPAEDIELQPDIELLYKSIAKLKDEQREVLLMFHIMGFSQFEIQEHLGISEAAVKNRLVRARTKLKEMLTDYHFNFSKTDQI